MASADNTTTVAVDVDAALAAPKKTTSFVELPPLDANNDAPDDGRAAVDRHADEALALHRSNSYHEGVERRGLHHRTSASVLAASAAKVARPSLFAPFDACHVNTNQPNLSKKARRFYKKQNAIIHSFHAAMNAGRDDSDAESDDTATGGCRVVRTGAQAANLSLTVNVLLTVIKVGNAHVAAVFGLRRVAVGGAVGGGLGAVGLAVRAGQPGRLVPRPVWR